MKNTKKITYLAVLTALYVVLSAFLKINLISNIQIDLGYIAFAVALCMFGPAGALVGVIGCALESVLFSAYGFSVSWAAANLIIGVGCGLIFSSNQRMWIRILAILIFGMLGLGVVKTVIECSLYGIPYAVKIPKNAVAFLVDSAVMIAGLFLYHRLEPVIRRRGAADNA